jgi:adenylate kinase
MIMHLVFSWIQWCGKWTQARILVDDYWYKLLEMWKCLRDIAWQDTELWRNVKQTIEAWLLMSPDVVWEIIKDVLKNNPEDKLILDWFVRNEWNKKSLEEISPDYKVVFFELSKEKAIDRLLGRMYNPKTWETFPSGTTIDPETWDELIKRKDDNEKSILKRIDEFMNNTLPTVENQKTEWRVIEVNADQSIDQVAKEMINKLWLSK